MELPRVDLIVLSRDAAALDLRVETGLKDQIGVRLHVHRITGTRTSEHENRVSIICRARNLARHTGTAPWVMFLDDDVVLEPNCISRLVGGHERQPHFAALAADYLDECHAANTTRHVGMGATLFRRSALRLFEFRWKPGRCECQCCCDDLRALGLGIEHLPAAKAVHLNPVQRRVPAASTSPHERGDSPQILVAFDRRHLAKFRRQFLSSLRRGGNREQVTVVGYGLYPSERSALTALPGLRVIALPNNGVMAPVRRLKDFQSVVESLPEATPVAYWDAGDVLFQSRLEPLWKLVRDSPDRLLAVREPRSHPQNVAVREWTMSIHDPAMRDRAFRLLSTHPFLNSGFAAGTASAMLAYLREADRMLHAADLAGTSDWGDQTALNLYCHTDPDRWREIEEGWNYCVHDRWPGQVRVAPSGRIIDRRGTAIHVVHGNARSLRRLTMIPFV